MPAPVAITTRTPRVAPTHWLVCHGDSITLGATTTDPATKSYPYLVYQAALTQDSTRVFGYANFGINGQGLNYVYTQSPSNQFGTLTADAVTRVDPILSQPGATKYLVIFAGTNDIFLNSTTGANTWTLLQTYISARISAGWTAANICVGTMLPRQSSNESNRTALNNAIRSNQGTYGYKIADFAANATMGTSGQENNATYYSDTIHPTDAGQVILGNIVSAQLFP